MIANKHVCQLLVFLLISAQQAFAQDVLIYKNVKLEEAIGLALQHNKKLKIKNINADVSKLREKDLKNEKLPDIEFLTSFSVLSNINQYQSGVTNPSTSYEVPRIKYNFTLEASIPIYTGGKLKAEEEKAEVETEIADLRVKKEERDVKLEIITAYLNALHIQEQQALISEKMHEDTLVIRQTEKLKLNGAVTYNDVLRTKLQLSNHQMAYSELEKDYAILEHQIKTILALPEEASFTISTKELLSADSYTAELNDLVEEAYQKSEVLHINKKEIELKELDKKIVRSNVLPQISGGGEYGYNYPNFMFFPPEPYLYRFGAVGVNLKMPLSNFYKNKVKMKMVNKQISQAKIEVEEREELIRHDVFAAQRKLDEVNKKIKIAEEAIGQAKENYRIVKVKYSNQLSLITELIDADNAWLEAESNLISLQINRQLKYYQLQYILGNI
ncbi:TolC family protein [Sphingobacterium rhinopitheci]|uniref:TolC family protein n=1 Tax=Sphingobacterium rhinopitheci TaxID=2781960 RepID=UPI001F527775|nr:TolC family protein [Sphingobacterium rhinopitheci]MCI0922315.1 TolC family protein [Sphingobacterium rhinopitheci]